MLTALDLAGIPLLSAPTAPTTHPIVLAGGHAAFNPEPIADFIDAAVLGDGEEAVLEITGIVREWKAEGRPGGRDELLLRLARTESIYVPRFYDVDYLPDGRIQRVVPNRPGRAVPGAQAHDDGPRRVAVPEEAAGAARRDGARAVRGGDLPRLHPGLPVLPGRHDHPPGAGAVDHHGRRRWSRRGWSSPASPRWACSRCPAPTTPRSATCAPAWPSSTRTPTSRCRCRRTRVDAFNIDLAQELSRNGRRTGLTFAPEGGSERIRKVINKMVSEEDLIRTVVTAYSNGWRQVKLYFMCGLPTETDEDVLQIARLAHEVIKAGRAATGTKDIRCTVSIGGFVPKPHTPFQWAAMEPPGGHRQPAAGCSSRRSTRDRSLGRAIGYRYHDGEPSLIEGLLVARRPPGRRGHPAGLGGGRALRRLERALLVPPLGRRRRARRCPAFGVDLDWFTTREREQLEVLPWDHLDSGLDKDWLWQDWQDSLTEYEQDDCRWTPCFDCGVCPSMDTEIQIGPTGQQAAAAHPGRHGLTRAAVPDEHAPRTSRSAARRRSCSGSGIRYAKRGPLRFTSHRDFARAFERAMRRAGVPIAFSQGFTPHPKISYASAAPTGVASEAEYLEIGLQARVDPAELRAALDAALSPGLDVLDAVEAPRAGSLADRIDASRWRIELPGVEPAVARRGGRRRSWRPTRCWSSA